MLGPYKPFFSGSLSILEMSIFSLKISDFWFVFSAVTANTEVYSTNSVVIGFKIF